MARPETWRPRHIEQDPAVPTPHKSAGLELALAMVRARMWALVKEMGHRGMLNDPQAFEHDGEARQLLGAYNALEGLEKDLGTSIRPEGAPIH